MKSQQARTQNLLYAMTNNSYFFKKKVEKKLLFFHASQQLSMKRNQFLSSNQNLMKTCPIIRYYFDNFSLN